MKKFQNLNNIAVHIEEIRKSTCSHWWTILKIWCWVARSQGYLTWHFRVWAFVSEPLRGLKFQSDKADRLFSAWLKGCFCSLLHVHPVLPIIRSGTALSLWPYPSPPGLSTSARCHLFLPRLLSCPEICGSETLETWQPQARPTISTNFLSLFCSATHSPATHFFSLLWAF